MGYNLVCCSCILKCVFAYLWWILLGNTYLYIFDGYFIFMEMLSGSVKHSTPKTNKHRTSKIIWSIHTAVQKNHVRFFLLWIFYWQICSQTLIGEQIQILFILFSWVLVMWMPKPVIWSLCLLSGNAVWCSTVQHE